MLFFGGGVGGVGGVPDMSLKDYKYCHYYPDNNSRNKHRTNNKISFIDNPYIFLAVRFMCNYLHHKAISGTMFL